MTEAIAIGINHGETTPQPIQLNRGGRPTRREQINKKIGEGVSKMTDEVLELLRQAFAVDATIEEACFYAGISDRTYYRWKENNPELCQDLERLRLTPILAARQTIVSGLKQVGTAQWFIERKRSDEFSTKSKVEHGGKIETDGAALSPTARAVALEYEERLRQAIVEGGQKKP